jgi:glycosyltransferase involved in cell wall biosynthesis
VPQGLAFDTVAPLPAEKKSPISPVRLMFLGRIDPLKGLHLLLEALKDIPGDKIELDIYGQPGNAAYEEEWREKNSHA